MRLIEAGWLSYLEKVVPKTAGAVQIEETRRAFYAGAAQLFHDINTGLDADQEVTENDVKRMESINAELRAFRPQ